MSEAVPEQAQEQPAEKPAAEPVVDAQEGSELDRLLAQYDTSQTVEPEQKPEPKSDDRLEKVLSFVEQEQRQRVLEQTNKDIKSAVDSVKENLGLPDNVVETLLYGQANKDPRFLQAFQQRSQNPQAWDAVVKAFAKDIGSAVQNKPDKDLTGDREAVASLVRGESTTEPADGPSDKEIWNMPPDEFQKLQEKHLGRR